MKLFKSYRKLLKSTHERGQSIVEFALLAPILLLLFMGMFDFGWLLHQQIQFDNATRLGARRGAVGSDNATIIARMQEVCEFDLVESEITIEVRSQDGTVLGDSSDRTPDNIIHVSVNRDNVQLITPVAAFISNFTSINLNSEAEFLIE